MGKQTDALGPAVCFMQYLEHLNFLEYFLGVEKLKGAGMHMAEDQFLISYEYKNECNF